nr:N-acetylmuramoyl-L-alanine amidase [uncultured Schaedlerella sp.]
MMKGKRKKLVAWLLALTMLMSPASGFRAFADEDVPNQPEQSTVTADPVDDTEPADSEPDVSQDTPTDPGDVTEPEGAGGTDDPSVTPEGGPTVPPVADDQTVTDEPADVPEEQEADTEDPAVEDGGLINAFFLGEKSIQAPGEQNLVVSFGDGSEQLASVKLILAGEDGRQSEILLTEKKDSYYQFVKTYDNNEAGTYRLVAFAYELDGHKKRIDFEKIGISANFSVNSEAAQAEGECTEDAGISVTALTSDEISDDLTSEIESTIQEAADEAVETVNEGSVELGASSTDQAYSRAGVSKELTALTDQAVNLGSYSAPKAYTGTASSIVVVLDPGHGGNDNGASANGLIEKNINLRIAQACKAELEKHTGVKVYMTRTSDKYLSLEARVEAAKLFGATLFVSIHMNSSEKKEANGAEVYYPNANYNPAVSAEGKQAAQSILNELVDLGLSNRGVKFLNSTDDEDGEGTYADGSVSDYYSVIRNSKKNGFPGIIVEHAFLTNEDDAKELKDPSFLVELGKADARGILKYCQTRTDYSSVYDFNFYMNRYPDLKRVYGNNPVGALQHFVTSGMNERRQASKEFSVDSYMNRYPDLKSAFGNNYSAYYLHYINFGKKEGRIATVDGSSVNTDSKPSDNVPNNTAENTIYAGMDYKDVYDYEYYINRYGDIAAAFTGDYAGALRHFVQNGMNEGRQAKGTFNVNSYSRAYPDLIKAFGDSLKSYYIHYIEYGKAEGRKGVFDDEYEGDNRNPNEYDKYVTKYGMVDYAPVYDYNYYISQYSDVRKACESDPYKVLQHFVRHGMDEGRIAKNKDTEYTDSKGEKYTVHEFNVYAYKSSYSDLRAAFGNDLKKYYLHYINSGRAEKRTSVFSQEAITQYQGVEYKDVYNFDYYTKKYPDLYAAFGNDPSGAIQHFVNFGIKEKRQACEEFNISAYKNNYVDLRNAFGDNDMAYVRHYIECGKAEKRNAKSAVLHSISTVDSPSQTTKNQMVLYFLANNSSYPNYYAKNTNIDTISKFCDLYITECNRLNIKPEVAFCQAMKETKFLQFGGDVKISQYNFAGLGATGNNESGATFRSIEEGIRAHVQHLYAYANKNASESNLGVACVDPRFKYVTKGSAPYVEWLGQKENPIPGQGWATAEGYGYSIINDYMNKLSTYNK